MRTHRIASIPGDGIGPEVIGAGLEVLEALAARDGGFRLALPAIGLAGMGVSRPTRRTALQAQGWPGAGRSSAEVRLLSSPAKIESTRRRP